MLKLMPFVLALAYGLLALQFSARRSNRMLHQNARPLRDPELSRLTDRMAAALDLPGLQVMVFDSPTVNGLAAADGRIYLTRGFLERRAQGEVSTEELASVVAHELGHVALGHARRRMIDFSGQNAAALLLSALLNRVLPGLGGWIANMLSGALMARLSRRDEYEADAYAAALLAKIGLGPAPQLSLLGKLAALTGGPAGGPAWLLSHPPAAERIAAVERLTADWPERRT